MALRIVRADYSNPSHGRALVTLLDHYARDPAGGGQGLSERCHSELVTELAKRPAAFSVLAYLDEEPVGLANCFVAFSTFACANIVNVHDLVVLDGYRRRGIARGLLDEVERISRLHDACKLTLEVLEGNHAARATYDRLGFRQYQLDAQFGGALFLQKPLSVTLAD